MACHHPIRAWRTTNGNVLLNREAPDAEPLALPCGGCLGCRTSAAKAWALRCHLELHEHRSAVFSTLTYDEAHEPPTLQKQHLAAFLKRLRTTARRKTADPLARIRFFACGEYGETTGRPHYHAILYGLSKNDEQLIQDTWQQGHTKTDVVTPARIAYCAGYTSKKLGYRFDRNKERVDPDTGEVYEWQNPFLQMSRNPGIGGTARKYTESWRAYAVLNGQKQPVPKYLHEAWKAAATTDDIAQLAYEKQQHQQGKHITKASIQAAEQIAAAKQRMKQETRRY